jgi:hypothetical protein
MVTSSGWKSKLEGPMQGAESMPVLYSYCETASVEAFIEDYVMTHPSSS